MKMPALVMFFVFLTAVSLATTINIPEDYETIQEGIDASSNGDEIIVSPGTYVENINFLGKAILVGSMYYTTQDTSYILQTIIDGDHAGSVVTFDNGEDINSMLSGFTLSNGFSEFGGGIFFEASSPSIMHVKIENNEANWGGGISLSEDSCPEITDTDICGNSAAGGAGIYSRLGSDPIFESVYISNNTASVMGGGIRVFGYSMLYMNNCLITNNSTLGSGGGVYFEYVSNVTFSNVIISDNTAPVNGGGIYSSYSTWDLQDVIITGNVAGNDGGGYYCEDSNPCISNCTISDNNSQNGGGLFCIESSNIELYNTNLTYNNALNGGGIYCNESTVSYEYGFITGNFALSKGGAIFCIESSQNLRSITINNNYADLHGGGIYSDYNADSHLMDVTISGNRAALLGGGIHCTCCADICFDSQERSSIYSNSVSVRGSGSDIFSLVSMTVIVDSFTVIQPSDFHLSPFSNFEYDILYGANEMINADIYVSPQGSNSNNGLDEEHPLKTITHACSVIQADSLNQRKIFLAAGTYSPSVNDENFPINLIQYVSLVGENTSSVFLDAEQTAGVVRCSFVDNAILKNMTITNGYTVCGGGLLCENSSPILQEVCFCDNIATSNGGAVYANNSRPVMLNVTFTNNTSLGNGGGIYAKIDSCPILVNCILWENSPQEIYFYNLGSLNELISAYSDVQGGVDEIVCNNNAVINWLEGNINANPLFVDGEIRDYHLTEFSACIDTGTFFLEYNGEVLINLSDDEYFGTAPDMGAFEYGNVSNHELMIQNSKLKIHNYPNPFNPETNIVFELSDDSNILLEIFNIKGQKVTTLVNEHYQRGTHNLVWNASNQSSDVYLLRFTAEKTTETRKLILLK